MYFEVGIHLDSTLHTLDILNVLDEVHEEHSGMLPLDS